MRFNKLQRTSFKTILLALLFIIPATIFAQGFYISGNQLKDANGNTFIMKGFSIPTAWFTTDVNNNIANIRNNTGANCLRIVVTTGSSDASWQTCVTNCIANKMIPMVELHDATGSPNANYLNQMAQFWASKAGFLTRSDISRYILINIANEWGDYNMANTGQVNWRNAYQTAISTIRNAGINTTLVIDAPDYGQDLRGGNTVKAYAPALQSYDPRHNLLFSIHMYCEWSTSGGSNAANEIYNIKNMGIPMIVGEFGYQHDAGNGAVCDIPEVTIMNACQNNGVGWLAWSLKGNGAPVQYLDMAADFAASSLYGWGNTVVWGSNGTKTAATASVFSTTTSGGGSVSDGTYQITFRHSGQSLNVEGASTADGGNVIQYPYGGGRNEQWFVKSQGNGQYSILNANSGRGLDVLNYSTADSADINQWYYSGANNQKWKIESVGSGYYRVVNVNSNKCIDMPGSTTNNVSIDQWTCNGGANQSFTFNKLSSVSGRSAAPAIVALPAASEKVTLYPNPSATAFIINQPTSVTYSICNATGIVVEAGKGQGKMYVGKSLTPGVYILHLRSQDKDKTYKLIKE